MSQSYPIWNKIEACIYKSGKSYGVKDDGQVEILVGSSSRYSFPFVNHRITKKDHGDGTREFRFYVDGQEIKRGIFNLKTKEFKIINN